MSADAIDRLGDELWRRCVRRLDGNSTTLARWRADDFAHMREGFVIVRLPEDMEPLVDEALAQWRIIEWETCLHWRMDRAQFLETIDSARRDFISGGDDWMNSAASRLFAPYQIDSMDWVDTFA